MDQTVPLVLPRTTADFDGPLRLKTVNHVVSNMGCLPFHFGGTEILQVKRNARFGLIREINRNGNQIRLVQLDSQV